MTSASCQVMIALCLCLLVISAEGKDIYVSPHGNDLWSGRLAKPNAAKTDGPCATLSKALSDVSSPTDRIELEGGIYFIESPISLNAKKSGITIEAERGAHPILLGGKPLTGWQSAGDGFWSVDLPDVKSGKWDFRLLLVNGRTCGRARYPATGYLEHETNFDVPWMSTTGGGWKRKPTEYELTHMQYKSGDLGNWLDIHNAELTIYHMWDESCVGIKAMDTATRTITFTNPCGNPPGAFGVHKYVIRNIRQGMTHPGQWYLDRTAGKVVYWPLPGEDMTKAVAYAPTTESILQISGTDQEPVRDVTLRGLTFEVTNTPLKSGGFGAGEYQGALQLYAATNCHLENLVIRDTAGQGVQAWNCSDTRIEGCDIYDTGACGIRANGADLTCSDCLVHDVGRMYPSAIGISISGVRTKVSHCEIHDTPYSGIVGGGADAIYEYNLIYRVMQVLHDGAAIYAGFNKGMIMRGNVVRDITNNGGYGASAYYLDEQSDDCIVEDNLSVDVERPTQNHMAHNNIIRNNVFIMSGDCSTFFARCDGYKLDHNIYYAKRDIQFHSPDGGITAMKNNILHSGVGKVEWETLVQYAGQGLKPYTPADGTIFADPLFVNPEKGDYRFRPNSPAYKLGIIPLDVRHAGLLRKRS